MSIVETYVNFYIYKKYINIFYNKQFLRIFMKSDTTYMYIWNAATQRNRKIPYKFCNFSCNCNFKTLTPQECWQSVKCCSSLCLSFLSSSLVTWNVESVSLSIFTTCSLIAPQWLSEKFQNILVYFYNYK